MAYRPRANSYGFEEIHTVMNSVRYAKFLQENPVCDTTLAIKIIID